MLHTSLWFKDQALPIKKVKSTGLLALWAACSFPVGDVLLCFQTCAVPQFILSQWLTLWLWLSHLTDPKLSKRTSCKKKIRHIADGVLQLNKKVGYFLQQQKCFFASSQEALLTRDVSGSQLRSWHSPMVLPLPYHFSCCGFLLNFMLRSKQHESK